VQQQQLAARAWRPMHCAPRSEDEAKVNKVTPALVEGFLAQLQRDSSTSARATPGRAGGSAGAWATRSWDE
jgi:hypothetical protein